MKIKDAIKAYKELGDYFSPEYQQENKVLSKFIEASPLLSNSQTNELIELLTDAQEWAQKYFVADILYMYDSFDESLLLPLLSSAIDIKDPSYNRIFLKPALKVFGIKKVVYVLSELFQVGDIKVRTGISSLIYWIRPDNASDISNLRNAVIERANTTDNIIELYYYKLAFRHDIRPDMSIPESADKLIDCIKGNRELEELLFKQLAWSNPQNG